MSLCNQLLTVKVDQLGSVNSIAILEKGHNHLSLLAYDDYLFCVYIRVYS